MRDRDVGAIIVVKSGGKLCGLVTDRDIVIRAIGEKRDPWNTQLDEICSHENVATVEPDTSIAEAVAKLRGKTVRRLPVVEDKRVVGIVSLGDLSLEHDAEAALAEIAAAPPNR
jgi:CBS domain-containing protein